MSHRWISANTLLAQWQALERLCLLTPALHAAVGPLPTDPKAQVPVETYLSLWRVAQQSFAKPCLPTALALAVPFGAFGILDYLTASAATLGGSLASLELHSRIVTEDTGFELTQADGLQWLTVRAEPHVPPQALEFTLAVLVSRLHSWVDANLPLQAVMLPGAQPADAGLHAQVFGPARRYDAPTAALALLASDLQRPVQRADPFLHDMLKGMAKQLALGHASRPDLELALRARLRDVLPQGAATPQQLASLLGMSERTLQRRLAQVGRSFSSVVDDFQHEEALRLLCDPRLGVAQVAFKLGYAEQSSFTRAFKRWTGTTPASWRSARGD